MKGPANPYVGIVSYVGVALMISLVTIVPREALTVRYHSTVAVYWYNIFPRAVSGVKG